MSSEKKRRKKIPTSFGNKNKKGKFFMTPSRFITLIEKLEEIHCRIIDVEAKAEINVEYADYALTLTSRIRDAFFHQLEAKTGWGRNEIKEIFESALASAL